MPRPKTTTSSASPSYFNVVAFYAIVFHPGPLVLAAVLVACSFLVFVPIRYVYPTRTVAFRKLSLTLTALWLASYATILWQMPDPDPPILAFSILYLVYYFGLSLYLSQAARSPPYPGTRSLGARRLRRLVSTLPAVACQHASASPRFQHFSLFCTGPVQRLGPPSRHSRKSGNPLPLRGPCAPGKRYLVLSHRPGLGVSPADARSLKPANRSGLTSPHRHSIIQ